MICVVFPLKTRFSQKGWFFLNIHIRKYEFCRIVTASEQVLFSFKQENKNCFQHSRKTQYRSDSEKSYRYSNIVVNYLFGKGFSFFLYLSCFNRASPIIFFVSLKEHAKLQSLTESIFFRVFRNIELIILFLRIESKNSNMFFQTNIYI